MSLGPHSSLSRTNGDLAIPMTASLSIKHDLHQDQHISSIQLHTRVVIHERHIVELAAKVNTKHERPTGVNPVGRCASQGSEPAGPTQ